MTRFIRLKEWGINLDTARAPDEAYMSRCDASLDPGPHRFRTDSNGYIVSGNTSPNAAPFLVFGDSVVENMFCSEERRMCAVLEQLMRESGEEVNVLNGGVTGATTLNLLNSFISKGISLNPKGVILMSGVIDIDVALKPSGFWTNARYFAPLGWMNDPGTPDEPYVSTPDWGQRGRLLAVFSEAAKAHDIPFWCATIPHRTQYDDPYITKKYRIPDPFVRNVSLRRGANKSTRDFCKNHQVGLIDLEAIFDHRSDLFYDEFHLNEFGAEEVAKAIRNAISISEKSQPILLPSPA